MIRLYDVTVSIVNHRLIRFNKFISYVVNFS
jgi:hypothetical protein